MGRHPEKSQSQYFMESYNTISAHSLKTSRSNNDVKCSTCAGGGGGGGGGGLQLVGPLEGQVQLKKSSWSSTLTVSRAREVYQKASVNLDKALVKAEQGRTCHFLQDDEIPCRRMRSGSYIRAMAEEDSGDSDCSPKPISTEHSPKLQIRSHSYLRAVSEVSINRSLDSLDPAGLLASPKFRSRNESYMRAMSTISQVSEVEVNGQIEAVCEAVFSEMESQAVEALDLPMSSCFRMRSHSYVRAIEKGCSQEEEEGEEEKEASPTPPRAPPPPSGPSRAAQQRDRQSDERGGDVNGGMCSLKYSTKTQPVRHCPQGLRVTQHSTSLLLVWEGGIKARPHPDIRSNISSEWRGKRGSKVCLLLRITAFRVAMTIVQTLCRALLRVRDYCVQIREQDHGCCGEQSGYLLTQEEDVIHSSPPAEERGEMRGGADSKHKEWLRHRTPASSTESAQDAYMDSGPRSGISSQPGLSNSTESIDSMKALTAAIEAANAQVHGPASQHVSNSTITITSTSTSTGDSKAQREALRKCLSIGIQVDPEEEEEPTEEPSKFQSIGIQVEDERWRTSTPLGPPELPSPRHCATMPREHSRDTNSSSSTVSIQGSGNHYHACAADDYGEVGFDPSILPPPDPWMDSVEPGDGGETSGTCENVGGPHGEDPQCRGSAQLLMSQKFQQFRELCEENLNPDAHPRPGSQDLAGFWDMLQLSIENISLKFDELHQAQSQQLETSEPSRHSGAHSHTHVQKHNLIVSSERQRVEARKRLLAAKRAASVRQSSATESADSIEIYIPEAQTRL
ncbi:hypothetical protein F7725_029163 [Dissostichus mawsoni]|uniref:Disks large-associated protein 1 n=1 Tax=Dissostichus mawsoni TaxID=36200 RepID=A0A7J5XHP0_DISMA|nr:hypothetical protein F7725_029163 [Dissostichus mawsoni]